MLCCATFSARQIAGLETGCTGNNRFLTYINRFKLKWQDWLEIFGELFWQNMKCAQSNFDWVYFFYPKRFNLKGVSSSHFVEFWKGQIHLLGNDHNSPPYHIQNFLTREHFPKFQIQHWIWKCPQQLGLNKICKFFWMDCMFLFIFPRKSTEFYFTKMKSFRSM